MLILHKKIQVAIILENLPAFSHQRTKGLETIKDHAYQFVNARVASDFPKNDGKQTPMRGHPVFIAQHATATCCRGCISKWCGIKKGRPLSETDVDFVVALIMMAS